MSGQYAVNAAAAFPSRVVAAASLYGVRLVTDEADSPHLMARATKADVYFGCAEIDHWAPLEMVEQLRDLAGGPGRSGRGGALSEGRARLRLPAAPRLQQGRGRAALGTAGRALSAEPGLMVYRIGLLGASKIAPGAVIAPAKTNPDFEVVAVGARDLGRAKAYARDPRHRPRRSAPTPSWCAATTSTWSTTPCRRRVTWNGASPRWRPARRCCARSRSR